MTRPAAVLAVDAGGSRIDAVLTRRDGTVLGAARISGPEHDGAGRERHLRSVIAAADAACRDADVDPAGRPVAELGMYCLAGADLPADDRRITRWLGTHELTSESVVRNDTFAVLRAGTERTWGVAVVCGYGTNCSGVGPDGRTFRFPAVGAISGDWGGGSDLGSAALWHAVRAEDGRGPRTQLRTLVPEQFGYRRPRQVTEAIYFGRLPEERVVELAPLVFRAAASGDAVARAIVDRQADEIAVMATTALRRLRITDLDADVVLGGGIFRSDDATFDERIRSRIADVAPSARVCILQAPPILGAALLGLDRLGVRPAAIRRVRSGLTDARLGADTRRRRE